MKKETHNKLVRDNIPEIIEGSGKTCAIKVVKGEELLGLLNEKLREEVDEYIESNDIEELVDIIEVIHGILYNQGITIEELEILRLKKKEERGGFSKGIKLLEVF